MAGITRFMIYEKTVYRLVDRYGPAFGIYADYFHGRKRLREFVKGKDAESGAGTDMNMPVAGSLKDMVNAAEKRKAVFYGKSILDRYVDDPSRTILFVTHELTLSGAPMVLLNLIRSFQLRGWQVAVLSREDGKLGPYAEEAGIPIIVVPGLFQSDFITKVRTLFRAIVVNTIIGAPAIQQLNGSDTPVIWWIHESRAVYKKESAREMPRSLSGNIHVYCVGQYAKRMLKFRAPRYRTENLLYHANDLTEKTGSEWMQKGHSRKQRKRYVSVGAIGPRKGQDVLLDAIDLLPQKVLEGSWFAFAGPVGDAALHEQIARKSRENPDRIRDCGELMPEEVYDLYRTCDWLVCSSRDDPMPVVVAEAMSLGMPCICSANTGSADIIREYGAGIVYDHDDPRRLAKLIEDSFNMSGEDYRSMSSNARRAYEEHFSMAVFEKNVDRLIEMIRRESK